MISPKPNTPWLEGYDGKTGPVAALIFNPDFQKKYQSWWTALLTTPSKRTGKRLIDEPALAAVEIQNEDSLFFWTFDDKNIPDAANADRRKTVRRLADQEIWLARCRARSSGTASAPPATTWPKAGWASGRCGTCSTSGRRAISDAMAFLTELQREFYQNTYAFLRGVGFKGVIATSGWTTASPEYLGPLDKYTNTVGDYRRPPRLFRRQPPGAERRLGRDEHAGLRRSQRAAVRPRNAWQAEAVRQSGDGSALRRQALDDFGNIVRSSQSISLRGAAVLCLLRRVAGQQWLHVLRARLPIIGR